MGNGKVRVIEGKIRERGRGWGGGRGGGREGVGNVEGKKNIKLQKN